MKLNGVCNEVAPDVIVECVSWRSKYKGGIKKKKRKIGRYICGNMILNI